MPNGKINLVTYCSKNSFALIVAALHKCALPEINGMMSFTTEHNPQDAPTLVLELVTSS